jgi:hypothetical protein
MSKPVTVELEALKDYIEQHPRWLNEDGIWLFLSTLGCWSVPPGFSQVFALVLTGLLFFRSYDAKRTEKRDFSSLFRELLDRAATEAPDEGTQGLIRLEVRFLRDNELATTSILRKAWPFLLCWGSMESPLFRSLLLSCALRWPNPSVMGMPCAKAKSAPYVER